MTTAQTAGRPRLKELREAAGWTQFELAEKLAYLAWTRGNGHVGANADMISKWERSTRGISTRYRTLLCNLFGVTPAQLGFPGRVIDQDRALDTTPPRRDAESLVSLLDQATSILDQLGAPATILGPELLAAQARPGDTDALGLLAAAADAAAGHARTTTATPDDLEHLTTRYEALYETTDPTALMPSVSAHVRVVTAILRADHGPATRRRLLRSLTVAATLAGRLAYDDFGDMLSGRAYLTTGYDAAREADEHAAASTAAAHLAMLAQLDQRPSAARDHLATANQHAEHAPEVAAWLATITAVIHADQGDDPAARQALERAAAAPHGSGNAAKQHAAHLAAATGHACLRADDHSSAREHLTTALAQLPPAARRARTLALLDLATAELRAGNVPEAFRHATTAANETTRVNHATGITRLHEFRGHAQRHASPSALRAIDAYLSRPAT